MDSTTIQMFSLVTGAGGEWGEFLFKGSVKNVQYLNILFISLGSPLVNLKGAFSN